jgi:hypothetical protein
MAELPPNRTPTAQLEHRIACLRRAYGRGLGRKPSLVEEAAMARAARLTARAEAAAADPTVDLNSLVRIDNAAARARASMDAVLANGLAGHDDYDAETMALVRS